MNGSSRQAEIDLTDTKSESAFRTIGELSAELGVPQHILRYWETRFPQLRPMTRAGNRRYYRPDDVALVRRIHRALDQDGFTIKGVQRLLAGKASIAAQSPTRAPTPSPAPVLGSDAMLADLIRVRDELRAALED